MPRKLYKTDEEKKQAQRITYRRYYERNKEKKREYQKEYARKKRMEINEQLIRLRELEAQHAKTS